MNTSNNLRVAVAGVLAISLLGLLASQLTSTDPTGRTSDAVRSGLGEEIIVMRTPGGTLEVATIQSFEQFDQRFSYSLLGIGIGETNPHIGLPATFRYHIDLAPEWVVRRVDNNFEVVAPAIEPTLPVGIDLGGLQKDVGGSWYLVALRSEEDLDALERSITDELASKAGSAVYLDMQRLKARQTVEEFVRKWLPADERWGSRHEWNIRVRFADESPGAS